VQWVDREGLGSPRHIPLLEGENAVDSNRFNELVKALASGQSRRGVLRGLAAGFAGSALSLIGHGANAAANPRGPGRLCRENADCIEGAICVFNGRNRVCACADCYNECVAGCFEINFQFNFTNGRGLSCEAECAIECSSRRRKSCEFIW
jgi:hypothetical protein